MMTETEAMAKALGAALKSQPNGFGANEAKAALTVISTLSRANKVSDDDADRCRVRLGNHSAIRQWAIAHGFIKAPTDALENAVSEEIARLAEVDATELANMAKK